MNEPRSGFREEWRLSYRESAKLASKADTRRFIKILVAVMITYIGYVVVLHLWNSHREERFEGLADQRASRAVFLKQLGRPDDVGFFVGEECWHYHFNRNPYASVCFGADEGDFLRSSYSIH